MLTLRSPRARGLALASILALAAAPVLVACGQADEPAGPGPPTAESPPDAASPAAEASGAEAPLNVVLITLDTTRADALGAYGQPRPTSPEIDRLAREGVRFAQVASSAPSTLPSHSTILTGKQPYSHGARSNSGYVLSDQNVTLAEVLRVNGYRTGAEIAAPVIGRQTQIDQGFEHFRDTFSEDAEGTKLRVGKHGVLQKVIQLDERMAKEITRRGIEFVGAHREEKFFLWLHYFDAHAFYTPQPEDQERIPDSPYHAEILGIDQQVGRLIAALEGLGLANRTLVVLTADHGEGMGEHGERTHSYFVYDATVRVPLILWGPPVVQRAAVVESLVRTVDVTPTILDLLGLPPLEGVQGVSLSPLFSGESDDLGLTAYGESIDLMPFGVTPVRYVQEGRWKYIYKVNPELYDVSADPGELVDQAAEEPEVAARLRERLEALVAGGHVLPSDAEVALDDATREQLEALGYLASEAPAQDELATLALAGPDPRDMTEDLVLMNKAMAAAKHGTFEMAPPVLRPLWEKYRKPFIGMELAVALVRTDRNDEASEVLRELIALDPANLDYQVRLADTRLKAGRVEEAESMLEAVIDTDRCQPDARALVAHLAFARRQYEEQYELLRFGVEECPESSKLSNNFAWILSTGPLAERRDGPRAVRLARWVIEQDRVPDASHQDTLAAALAEAGEFEAAVAAVAKAIDIESDVEPPNQLDALRRHRVLFEAGRPVREPPDTSS